MEEFFSIQDGEVFISATPTLIEKNESQNLFGYYFCIENRSAEKIQLLGKSWNITDDKGNRFSDDSAGFKGEIPDLEPGEFFEFSDVAPLKADNAVFYGSCQIAYPCGVKEVKFPTFSFAAAGSVSVN